MSKPSKEGPKFVNPEAVKKMFDALASRDRETVDYLNEVVMAQNNLGVLVTTAMQILIEKGLINQDELEKTLSLNKQKVLSPEGDCVAPVTSLLSEGGNNGGKPGRN